ncbi:MAG: hypothetical protein J5845_06760 [Lachnospiraceae bacterium]|nr:hypothetical protein [Lachnospiraceae bacterium]
MKYFIIALIVLAVCALLGIIDRIRKERALLAEVKKNFGVAAAEEINPERYESLKAYLASLPERDSDIDSITWNDLDMDRIFLRLNHTCSAIGEEVLFAWLHKPEMSSTELLKREHLTDLFEHDEDARIKAGRALLRMGKMRRISVYDYMMRLHSVKVEGNLKHYLGLVPYIAGFVLLGIGKSGAGMGVILLTALYNLATYLTRKGQIGPYLDVVSYIARWIGAVDRMTAELSGISNETLQEELAALKKDAEVLRPFARGAVILSPSDPSGGGLAELFMEYFRMLTHVDLIRFNNIYELFSKHQEELNRLFAGTGLVDASRAVASYRTSIGKYCVPVLHDTPMHTLKTEGIGHALIEQPVANSIAADRPVLLTGSNASGKSTFLKTIAVNAIFAQTIHTVIAAKYEADYFHILSSMALRDDIVTKESYYIVEIRSLKRIMDAAEGDCSVLCFVDEVLRGTNTAERIAASSRILRYLAEQKALVFAATHDLELTSLLADVYDNYHFSEQVKEDIVVFDYRLKPGKATSRNALKLLRMMDYPEKITDEANKAVEEFMNTGEWK